MTSLDSPTSEVNTFPYHAGKGQIMRSSIQAAESGDFIGEAIAAYDYKARSHKELGLQKGCRVFLKRKMRPFATPGSKTPKTPPSELHSSQRNITLAQNAPQSPRSGPKKTQRFFFPSQFLPHVKS
ncbi:unnamed protein product [Oikopleura dioica]|uniref:SH3 domain-containing protein n=1 Tax=Oikopleura dioica TaxID=34765 RepID=E4YJ93_OIKDI|nr:unnamed protein product [Oikopleura dioica]